MNDYILKKYGINFQNRTNSFEGSSTRVDKFPGTSIGNLTMFLIEWDSVAKINEGLLPDIEDALVNPNSEIENGSSIVDITIFNDVVDFYPDNGEIFTIPTLEFKEIVVGWRDFLLTSPQNGSII